MLLGSYYYGSYYYVISMGVRLKRAIKLFKNNVLSLYPWKKQKSENFWCLHGVQEAAGEGAERGGQTLPWKNCPLGFEKQFFLSFVNLLINVRHFLIKVYIFWNLHWNIQIFMIQLIFLTRVTSPPSFNFLDKIHTAIRVTLLSRRGYQDFFKKAFAWRHSVIIVMNLKNVCERTFILCQTTTTALFFEKNNKKWW